MKKIMNRPENLVYEMCKGIELAHPEIEFIEKYKVLKKKKMTKSKVTLISGGGSGHEPAHAGFIGTGLLDAAVCGDVFASPSQIQVYQAIRQTATEQGTLLIIKNYSGDMMNFKNAAQLAIEDGIKVDYVKVDDDIAVQDSLYTVGRRGVAGTIFVHKIAGAMAERGGDLASVKAAAEKAASNVRTLGFALSSCTVPAKGTPTFSIEEGEMEYGVGIHGEPGIKREKIISADELAERMVEALVGDLRIVNEEVALLINGFGGSPLQELYLLNHAVTVALHKRGIQIYRTFVGNFMTSIDMLGASVSLLKLDNTLKELLSEKCDSPALKIDHTTAEVTYKPLQINTQSSIDEFDLFKITTSEHHAEIKNNVITYENLQYLIDVMSDVIIRNEVPFCELDAHAGDGDFGMSISKGFKQLKREWNDLLAHSYDISTFLLESALIIMEYCGGASGPIWGSAFRAAGKSTVGKKTLSLNDFAEMMQAAVVAIQSTGERSFGRGAVVGDKTLIDALVPCADALENAAHLGMSIKEGFTLGAEAAVLGAKTTEQIVARMGRAGTVGERSIGFPDAGAHALGVIFTEVAQKIK